MRMNIANKKNTVSFSIVYISIITLFYYTYQEGLEYETGKVNLSPLEIM